MTVTLKPAESGDARIIFEAWGRYPENFTYLTAEVFADTGDAKRYLSNVFAAPGSIAFHVVGNDGTVVGIVKASVVGHRAQVGYVIHQPFSGNGYATEAVRQITRLLEDSPTISRIWATCALENRASIRVLEKCAYEREGILKNWVIYPAQGDLPFDNYSYVRLPDR